MCDLDRVNESIREDEMLGICRQEASLCEMSTAGIVLLVPSALLVIYFWFAKYRLQYLLRICLTLFILSSLMFAFLSSASRKDSLVSYLSQQFTWVFLKWEKVFVLSLLIHKSFWYHTCNVSATLTAVMVVFRYHYGRPLFIVKDSKSVGFGYLKETAKRSQRTVREVADERIRFRDPGDMMPVYVNGWIPLIASTEVVRGRVASVVAVGYKFAVFRGEDGIVSVMDAYCPHLGADLSAGGQVVGNCIECPFHGWQFSGKTGQCTKIPYSNSERALGLAKVKVWESCEKNGYIFVWHHAEGNPPTWEIPSIPEIDSGKWIYRGGSQLTVHCHIQEIPENGADIAHLPQVHSRFVVFGPHLSGRGNSNFCHDWEPQWETDESHPHIARAHLIQSLKIFSRYCPWTKIEVDIEQIGPAAVHLHMNTSFGRGVFLQYITTEAPQQQRIVHLFYTESRFKQFPANVLIQGEAVMIERDIEVWNNKRFLKNPLLVKEDKLIAKFRRWYSQFYSQNSPTLRDIRQKTLEW